MCVCVCIFAGVMSGVLGRAVANADFQLLQEMNKAATGRYEDMERYAGRLKESVDDIASKCGSIMACFPPRRSTLTQDF